MGKTESVRSGHVVLLAALLWLAPTPGLAQGRQFSLPPMSDTLVRVALAGGAGWTCELAGSDGDVDLLVFDGSGQRLLVQDITVGSRARVSLPPSAAGDVVIMRLRNNEAFAVNAVLTVQGQAAEIEFVSRQPLGLPTPSSRPPGGRPGGPPTSAGPPVRAPAATGPPTSTPPAPPVSTPDESAPPPSPRPQPPDVGAPVTPVSPTEFDALEAFIDRMRTAAGALRAQPDRVEVAERIDVTLTISPTSTEADLRARTEAQGAVIATAPARIAPRMRAHLSVPEGATVASVGSEDRAVHDTEDTVWQWTVTPSRPGELPLRAVLTAPVTIEGKDTSYDVRTFEARVTVFVTPATRVRDFLVSWEFLLTAIAVPVLGWAAKVVLAKLAWPRRRRKRGKREPAKTA